MRRLVTIMIIAVTLAGCASVPRYTAPFADLDQERDGRVEWWEFETFYPGADPKAFLEADGDKDGGITPEEWDAYLVKQRG